MLSPHRVSSVPITVTDPVKVIDSRKIDGSEQRESRTRKSANSVGRRSRKEISEAPDPGTQFLVGAGLVALSVLSRRRVKAVPKE